MSSLVESFRVRSDRKPMYYIDESDDDAHFLPRKPGTVHEKIERIVRSDAAVSVEDGSLPALADNYEADLTGGQSNSIWDTTTTKPYKKTDSTERLPLMEGEGEALRVLGFDHKDRAEFLDILMRFGVGDYDWKEFKDRMTNKSDKEIHDYGFLFLSHIADNITDSPTFKDGVPKEGLQIQHVLGRISVMTLISYKVRFAAAQTPLFSDDISSCYSELKGAKTWTDEQDLALLKALLKHGHGRWQDIVDDEDLKIQEVICQELNLPVPLLGEVDSQAQNGAQGSGDAWNQPQLHQDSSILYGFRDTQAEFIEKRVLLLEKVLHAEYRKELSDEFGDTIRYDSTELFAEENDEAVKSHQICYDEAAINWLLDCDEVGDEETPSDDEDVNGFLKGLKRVYVEGDNLAGLEDNYEAELTDDESNSIWATTATRPYKKTADSTERLPLMEGEGETLRVLGFNHRDRAEFLDILMRFGVGDYNWKEFKSRMTNKSDKEIHDYGFLFLSHISDNITDSPTFKDGVPKEGLQIQDVLCRISVMTLISYKVSFAAAQTPLFSDDISSRYSELKGAKTWKDEQDFALLKAVLKHGYGRWQDIVDDEDLKIQELNLLMPLLREVGSQAQNGAQGSGDARNQPQLHEFIEKRVLLLGKVLNAEYQKELSGGPKTNEQLKSEPKASNVPRYESRDADTQMTDQLPLIEEIASEDISVACDNDPNRLELVQLHDEV